MIYIWQIYYLLGVPAITITNATQEIFAKILKTRINYNVSFNGSEVRKSI